MLQVFRFLCFLFSIILLPKLQCNEKPNIIVFLADDLGFGDIEYNGDRNVLTLNLNVIAADGIILNKYYTTPHCTASRGAFLSAIHPIHSGTQNNEILNSEPRGFPLHQRLLSNYLKEFNYSTHAVGKWQLGFYKKEYTPTFRGFDSHLGFWTKREDYFTHFSTDENNKTGLDFRYNLELIKNASGKYSTEYLHEHCLRIIEQHDKRNPLFLFIAYQSVAIGNPNDPLQATSELLRFFPHVHDEKRKKFAAMLLAMDLSIGRIFRELHENEMLKNSIVIFASDNGGQSSPESGGGASNYPLRGEKSTLWEGGVRVPAFIWSPLLKKSGYIFDGLMHVTDWLPTLITSVTGKHFEEKKFYGKSMWNSLSEGLRSPRKEVLLNIDPIWNVSAIIRGKWKLIQGSVFPQLSEWFPPYNVSNDFKPQFETEAEAALRSLGRNPKFDHFHKLRVQCGKRPKNASSNCKPNIEPCLFNLHVDPCEYNNVAKMYPKIVRKLWQKIILLNQTSVKPANTATDKCADPNLHENSWTYWTPKSC